MEKPHDPEAKPKGAFDLSQIPEIAKRKTAQAQRINRVAQLVVGSYALALFVSLVRVIRYDSFPKAVVVWDVMVLLAPACILAHFLGAQFRASRKE